MSKVENDQIPSVAEVISQAAAEVGKLEVPAILDEETKPKIEIIFHTLISIEKTLWNIDQDELRSEQGVWLRSVLRDFDSKNSLPSILSLVRTILQMFVPQFFNPEGAEKIAKNMQLLSLNLAKLAQKIARISTFKDYP